MGITELVLRPHSVFATLKVGTDRHQNKLASEETPILYIYIYKRQTSHSANNKSCRQALPFVISRRGVRKGNASLVLQLKLSFNVSTFNYSEFTNLFMYNLLR